MLSNGLEPRDKGRLGWLSDPASFMNQNSLVRFDLEKLFFAPRPKIVLPHIRGVRPDIAQTCGHFRFWTHCACQITQGSSAAERATSGLVRFSLDSGLPSRHALLHPIKVWHLPAPITL